MTLSERLRSERKKAGLSQVQFAEKLGLNARTYASYERGERDISTALLLNICKELNISSDRLLGNPVEPPEKNNLEVVPRHPSRRAVDDHQAERPRRRALHDRRYQNKEGTEPENHPTR